MVQVPGSFAAFSRDKQTEHLWLFGSEAERMKDSYQFFLVKKQTSQESSICYPKQRKIPFPFLSNISFSCKIYLVFLTSVFFWLKTLQHRTQAFWLLVILTWGKVHSQCAVVTGLVLLWLDIIKVSTDGEQDFTDGYSWEWAFLLSPRLELPLSTGKGISVNLKQFSLQCLMPWAMKAWFNTWYFVLNVYFLNANMNFINAELLRCNRDISILSTLWSIALIGNFLTCLSLLSISQKGEKGP